MENKINMQSIKKKKKLPPVISVVTRIVLIIAVLFLYLQNIELKKELSEVTGSNKNQPGTGPEYKPADINNGPESNITDKAKIKKLEAQVSDMQEWQDYLEDTNDNLEEILQMKEEEGTSKQKAESFTYILSCNIDEIARVGKLTPDEKAQLVEMLPGFKAELQKIYDKDISGYGLNQFYKNFFEQISEMFPEKYSKYKYYKKVEHERDYVESFESEMLLNDFQLNNDQKRKMIDAIYEENQNYKFTKPAKYRDGEYYSIEYLNHEQKNLENQKLKHNNYIDIARDIMSEPQLKQFQKYLDYKITYQEMSINRMKNYNTRLKEEKNSEKTGVNP